MSYGQPKPFTVSSHAEDRVPSFCCFEAEQALVKPDRWIADAFAYPAPLPSVPLSFLNQLAGDAGQPVPRVDEVVELRVGSRLGGIDGFKSVGGDCIECGVCVSKLVDLAFRQWQDIELQRLFRRYLPTGKIFVQSFNVESCGKLLRNSSPCLNAGVSLRSFYDSARSIAFENASVGTAPCNLLRIVPDLSSIRNVGVASTLYALKTEPSVSRT